MRYSASDNHLELLRIARPKRLQEFFLSTTELLPSADASALIFIADLPRIQALYQNPSSLIWRDAGALLQTVGLAAVAYRLGFCPLGMLGTEIVEALALPRERAQPVGSALIGRPPSAGDED